MDKEDKEYFAGRMLETLLDCGSSDLDVIYSLIDLADKVGLNPDVILDNIRDRIEIDFQDVVYVFMHNIMRRVVERMSELHDDIDTQEIQDRIFNNFEPYINYLDTHFNIEALDNVMYEDEINIDEVAEALYNEFKKEVE